MSGDSFTDGLDYSMSVKSRKLAQELRQVNQKFSSKQHKRLESQHQSGMGL